MRPLLNSQRGFSLIEALIAGAILIVITMGFLGMLTGHQKEVRRLTQKLSLQDINSSLKGVLQDPTKCAFNLLSGTSSLNTTPIPTTGELDQDLIVLQELHNSSTASSNLLLKTGQPIKVAPGLTVTKMALSDWSRDPMSADLFMANLVVTVQSDVGPIAPMKISGIFIRTDPTTPPTAKVLLGCGPGNGPPGPFQGISTPGGSVTGTYNGTNTNSYPILVTASGGNDLTASGDFKNTCHLAGPTGESRNNNQQWIKACFITFWVAPGTSYNIQSKPLITPTAYGNGTINVYITK